MVVVVPRPYRSVPVALLLLLSVIIAYTLIQEKRILQPPFTAAAAAAQTSSLWKINTTTSTRHLDHGMTTRTASHVDADESTLQSFGNATPKQADITTTTTSSAYSSANPLEDLALEQGPDGVVPAPLQQLVKNNNKTSLFSSHTPLRNHSNLTGDLTVDQDYQSAAHAAAAKNNNSTNSNDESFSACLLVMDENFRLHEWIAYHYHVLPLRYLVVAIDPNSKESPEPIFDQFRRDLNMTIVSWIRDSDFMTGPRSGPLPASASTRRKRKRYKLRQRQFLSACLTHLHQHNRTWTALWDPDEYIAYNRYNISRTHATSRRTATAPPDMGEPGTILRYLKDYGEDNCIAMARVTVGSNETVGLLNESSSLPIGSLDPRQFDTVRYRYRGRIGEHHHGVGKCLANVGRMTLVPPVVPNPHRAVTELCPQPMGPALHRQGPFYLNHFISSWEAYSYRDDVRKGMEKSYEAYMNRAVSQSIFYENKLSPWLPSFLQNVGRERGIALLQHSGIDPNFNASFKIEAWRMIQG